MISCGTPPCSTVATTSWRSHDNSTQFRAAGVLLGMACGDALGAPFEFGLPLGPDFPVAMKGGGSMGWMPAARN